jgi:hypothetical protein
MSNFIKLSGLTRDAYVVLNNEVVTVNHLLSEIFKGRKISNVRLFTEDQVANISENDDSKDYYHVSTNGLPLDIDVTQDKIEEFHECHKCKELSSVNDRCMKQGHDFYSKVYIVKMKQINR